MRIAFAVVLLIHGLIHLLGFVKGFGLSPVASLRLPVTRLEGVLWLLAAVGWVTAAAMLFASSSRWWVVATPALLLSQGLILHAWADAKAGTLANAVALLPLVVAALEAGPSSYRSRYQALSAAHLAAPSGPVRLVTEAELEPLPPLLRQHLQRSGVVGKPHVEGFRARYHGRFRRDVGAAWMDFTSDQHNFIAPSARLFFMDATLHGVPMEALHVFEGADARMQVSVASLVQVVDGRGPEMNHSETVTIFNDLCVMAPAALLDLPVRWTTLGDDSVEGEFTRGTETVKAVLTFDRSGDLVNFVSQDRAMSSDGKTYRRVPWSTPMSEYGDRAGARLAHKGVTVWKLPEGDFAYGEFLLDSIEYFPSAAGPATVTF